jgi:formylglycine-generating enzyme
MKRIKLGLVLSSLFSIVFLGTTSGRPGDSLASVAPASAATHAGLAPTARDPASQALLALVAESAAPDSQPSSTSGACGADMVDVEGDYCPNVQQECLRWLDPDSRMRCLEFAPTPSCLGKLIHKHFCIDRFEYPNVAGARPVVMTSWYEARDTCATLGKRLCGDTEWTLACEGHERLPYPYGLTRSAEACNIDKPHPDPDEKALADPKTRDAEVARLDQRDASGDRTRCVSPFGVHDMTGNVDEWVVNESGRPFASGLKGGYWGPVRTRCRPMTSAHNEQFMFYQIGFRCCADAPNGKAGTLAATSRIPLGG